MKKKLISIILTTAIICSSFLIFANADSIKLGDINEDGEITASDARIVLRVSAEIETLPEEKLIYADVNFDKEITASDARAILRASAEIEPLPEMPSQDNPEETTTQETTTETTPETTEPETEIIAEKYPASIDAFLIGKFYLEATMGTGEDAAPIKMAMNDKGYEFSADLEFLEGQPPLELSFMQLSKTFYVKYPDATGKRKYFALDEETAKTAKEVLGLDINEIFSDDLMNELDFGKIENYGKPAYTTGKYNNEDCDIYTFNTSNGKIAFFAIGENVKRIVFLNDEGTADSYIEVINLSKRIPGKMLSTQGCQEAELLEFIADLMAFVPQE